jgi:hypothetical protein
MGAIDIVLAVLGVADLAASWLVWTGRWKAPGTDVWQPNWAFTLLPAGGVMLLSFGLDSVVGNAVYYVAIPVLLVAWVLSFWQPEWFGPRWWRERDKSHVDMGYAPNLVAAGLFKPDLGEQGSLARVEREMAPARPFAKLRAALVDDRYGRPTRAQRPGIVEGYVLVYERGLIFAARPVEDKFRDAPTVLRMPASSLRRAQRLGHGVDADGRTRMRDIKTRLMPRVRIDGSDGSWILETRRAGRLMAELERHYGIGDHAVAIPSA